MRNVWSLQAVVLFVLHYGSVYGGGCHYMLNGCCKLCNPGYFLKDSCGPCLPCPSKGYTDTPDSRPSCRLCRRCEGIFEYKSHCSATKNAVCRCQAGMKCADEECSQCENNPCQAGQQLVSGECENCPSGTFNPGPEGICKQWKNCLAVDAVILVNGTAISDVVCGNHLAKPTSGSTATVATGIIKAVPSNGMDVVIPIITSIAFFIILLIVIFVCLFVKLEKIKNKFRPIKRPKDEDGCSCHFPEEEDGGEDSDTRTMTPATV